MFALISGPPKSVAMFGGKVVLIADGDTVLVDRKQLKVRFEGIAAPEKSQAFRAKAKDA